jgi:MarR family 2-MHQ and catechol resistance regulon transcriptional repressor
MDTDTTTIMVICDSLEKKGLLKRMKDPSDRRVNRLVLTEKGKDVISKAYPLMMKRYEFFVETISEEELDTITPILEKLYLSIKSQYEKEMER